MRPAVPVGVPADILGGVLPREFTDISIWQGVVHGLTWGGVRCGHSASGRARGRSTERDGWIEDMLIMVEEKGRERARARTRGLYHT